MSTFNRVLCAAVLALGSLGVTAAMADGDGVAPSATIATAEGATIVNLPFALPSEAGVTQGVSGTASDDLSGVASVSVMFRGEFGQTGGTASLTCDDEALACSWSYTPAFALVPGDYEVVVWATDKDGNVGATSTVGVQVV